MNPDRSDAGPELRPSPNDNDTREPVQDSADADSPQLAASEDSRIGPSLQKKRARDRRAQQKLREKRMSHVQGLENHVSTLEDEVRGLRHVCEVLYQENQVLHARQEDIRQSVASWGRGASTSDLRQKDQRPGRSLNDMIRSSHNSGFRDLATVPIIGESSETFRGLPNTSHPTQASFEEVSSSFVPSHVSTSICQQDRMSLTNIITDSRAPNPPSSGCEPERWSLVPAHEVTDVLVSEQFAQLLARPDMASKCPYTPKPVEIMYGSRDNLLAHLLNGSAQRWPLGDPERLAAGFLSYRFIRWTSNPTKESFSYLCDFQRPVDEQIRQSHHFFIDFIWWPRLRANMITYSHLYDPLDAMSLLTCCQKVRWPWRKPILLPSDNGELVICPEFYDTMTRLDGWGLTDEYIQYLGQYPELLEGLDVESLRYQFI